MLSFQPGCILLSRQIKYYGIPPDGKTDINFNWENHLLSRLHNIKITLQKYYSLFDKFPPKFHHMTVEQVYILLYQVAHHMYSIRRE